MKRKRGILIVCAWAALLLAACGRSDSSSGTVNGGGTSDVNYGEMTDTRDGQTYKTVTIGTQTWMAENLNYKVDSSWCYDDDSSNCQRYGRLYQWAAAMGVNASYNSAILGDSLNHQGVCPSGWHLPSSSEWTTLEAYASARSGVGDVNDYGDWSEIGAMLRSTGGWNYDIGTDAYGFSALPAGFRYRDGRGDFFHDGGCSTYFWSATEYDASIAYSRYLYYDYAGMGAGYYRKDYAFSVRCVRN